MKSEALEKLRSIARYSVDPIVATEIEAWIQRHVVELQNSLTLTEMAMRGDRDTEYLEYENKVQIRKLAEAVVERGSQFREEKRVWKTKRGEEIPDGIVRYRKICLITE